MLKVQVMSRETIRPSSPTPQDLQTNELSLLDQISPKIYIHILLFYSNGSLQLANRLKSSLAETLKHFFPLAGRIRASDGGILYVDCNYEGADFVEAQVDAYFNLAHIHSSIDQFSELLPIKNGAFDYNDPLLAVQFSAFRGQGFALGCSISHLIADGASMAMFLDSWANITRGLDLHHEPRFDCSSVFPPRPLTIHRAAEQPQGEEREAQVVIKRFILSSEAEWRLKNDGTAAGMQVPTRVEAVSALVWQCLNRVRGSGATTISHVVNLRKKMAPALSEGSFGNMWTSAIAVAGEGSISYSEGGHRGALMKAIRNGVRKVGEDYAKKRAERQWQRLLQKDHHRMEEGEEDESCVDWIFTSWCRMPFYRADFGAGQPLWVACGIRDMNDVCVLLDAKDGDGVEIWLWLPKEEMERIEKDPMFLDFIS